MNILNKVLTLIAGCSLLATPALFAANDLNAASTPYLSTISQYIDVGDGAVSSTSSIAAHDSSGNAETINSAWLVKSNGGYEVTFTGGGFNEDGTAHLNPSFSRIDQNADGTDEDGSGMRDSLVTVFGMVISGHSSLEGSASWRGGATPIGTPAELELAVAADNSPGGEPLRIVGNDATEQSTVTLYAKGTSDFNDQSGDYTMTVTMVATADPTTVSGFD